ncbi:MAG: hypothetical protein V4709_11060 [Pseudomonadota bacterium]
MNNSATMDEFKNTTNQATDQARATAGKVADEVKASGSVIGNEVKNFIADLEEMVGSKTIGGLDVSKIKSDITSRIATYKSQAKAASEQAITQVKHQAEGVNTYVHDEPWKAIGVGFAVGLLLGVVISRR